jgi:hypothetical protein
LVLAVPLGPAPLLGQTAVLVLLDLCFQLLAAVGDLLHKREFLVHVVVGLVALIAVAAAVWRLAMGRL